jgi:hypothetical protein
MIRPDEVPPAMRRCMSPEDQARYNPTTPGIHPPYEQDHHPVPVNDSPEKVEQSSFANWCLLQGYRPLWHSTHRRSTANRGCPDFVVAAKGTTFWIEFKRPGFDLSIDQRTFFDELKANGVQPYLVYGCAEAIALIEQYG